MKEVIDMVSVEFAEASTEINMILKCLPKSYIEKIPKHLIKFFEDTASKDYIPQFDPTLDLDHQKLKEKTKDILAVLYMNYWCSKEQKQEFKNKIILNEKNNEKMPEEKYSIDIFENKKKMKQIEQEERKENLALQVKKEMWYNKILNNISKFIKNIFNKK